MSREQRRMNRRTGARGAGTPPSRRTPVRAPGGTRLPWVPIVIAGGTFLIVLLIAYLILQAGGGGSSEAAWVKAEKDDSPDLPGTFAPSQGRGHFDFLYSSSRPPTPFCDGVPHAASADASVTPASTAAATSTPAATATPAPVETESNQTPGATPSPPQGCIATNPPSSGQHLGVQRNVDLGQGAIINIPPDPDVYPHDIVIPRDAIAHALEHAGVFVGWNCKDGDTACTEVVDELERIANDRIDNHDDRVIMSRDPDLPEGEIGLSGWTRWDRFSYTDFDEDRVVKFLSKHSCRFDPEGFCG